MAYYKGLFKIHKIKILAKERYIESFEHYSLCFNCRYLIQLENGKRKVVKSEKIIFP